MSRARNDALISAFAKTLTMARLQCGLTQEELAHRADVDRTFIWLLESGRRQPTISVLFALAHALSLNPETLVEQVRRALPS